MVAPSLLANLSVRRKYTDRERHWAGVAARAVPARKAEMTENENDPRCMLDIRQDRFTSVLFDK